MIDDQQFLDALNENQARLRRLCRVYCREASDRDDLLQDMLIAAWRHRATFREDAAFSTWMYRVAVNVALQRLRRQRRLPRIATLEDVEPAGPGADADRILGGLDLATAINALNEVDRTVVALYLDGNPHSTIAHIVGTSTNAITVRLSRIRHHLRHSLTQGAPDDHR